ncbi:MAG: hypothetical protein U9Q58_07630 [Pseudomonadota bacterium]|nr:hypothetical protein [Pseudomonadota bacterium]
MGMQNYRRKPIGEGLLRIVPFTAAGILTMVFYYSQNNISYTFERDSIILFIFTLLCITVYFAVSHQLPYSKKNIIEDLLATTLSNLGKSYRINIVQLISHPTDAFDSYFKIKYSLGYEDHLKYKEKITFEAPGVSHAWKKRKVKYLSGKSLCKKIDHEVKHLWSSPILNNRGVTGHPKGATHVRPNGAT